MTAEEQAWLDQVHEEALDPAQPICDPHHHLWDHPESPYCMFESNFPVDKKGCSYAVLWNAFKRIAANRSAAERHWLFHDTAATAYRLDGAREPAR